MTTRSRSEGVEVWSVERTSNVPVIRSWGRVCICLQWSHILCRNKVLMFVPEVKSHVVNMPWIFLGRGQVWEGTTCKISRRTRLLRKGNWRSMRSTVPRSEGTRGGILGAWSAGPLKVRSVDWCGKEAVERFVNWKLIQSGLCS